jgi:hypothetical protein
MEDESMRTGKLLQSVAGFVVAAGLVGEAGAVTCRDETPITGGGFFSASCTAGSAEGEAVGSSNSSTGFIQAEIFSGDDSASAFASLRTADALVCGISDNDVDGVAENQQQSFCAGATLVRVDVND